MNKKLWKKFKKNFKAHILDSHERLGDYTVIINADGLHEIAEFMKADPKHAYDMLTDVTAVDYLNRKPRFEVVYHFYSTTLKHRLRIRIPVEEGSETVPSLVNHWKAAKWGEREVWDMFGIKFDGHPDLRRILLYEEFQGHPLRKDYPIQKSQPRMDLRAEERDAVEDYKRLFIEPREQPEA